MSEKIKVAVLVSGGRTNLQALIDKEADGQIPDAHIVKVISSREDALHWNVQQKPELKQR